MLATHQRIVRVRRCQRGCRLRCKLVKLRRRHALVDAHRNLLRHEHLRKHAAASAAEHQFEYFRELDMLRAAATGKQPRAAAESAGALLPPGSMAKAARRGGPTGSQKSGLRPYDSFMILAVILSKWTGSLRPSRLMTNMALFADGTAQQNSKLTLRSFVTTEPSKVRAAPRPQHRTGLEPYVAGRRQVEKPVIAERPSMHATELDGTMEAQN